MNTRQGPARSWLRRRGVSVRGVSTRRVSRRGSAWWLAVVPLAFMALFFVYPSGALILRGLTDSALQTHAVSWPRVGQVLATTLGRWRDSGELRSANEDHLLRCTPREHSQATQRLSVFTANDCGRQ